jgi:hypothetical protein
MRLLASSGHRFDGDRVMSLNLVAGIDFPSQLSTATTPYFLLGLNAAGAWVIRETTGRRAGLFPTREAAIKYARDESADGNFTIVHAASRDAVALLSNPMNSRRLTRAPR